MSYAQLASNIGRTKRQEMEDSMKRKGIERQLAELAKKNPAALVQIAGGQRKPGSGAYAVAPGGPAAAIAAKMRGPSANNGGAAPGPPGAGSPAAVGDSWRVSDAERLAGDTYNVGRDNSPVPSDATTQAAIRAKLSADLDASTAEQKAILARAGGAVAPAAGAVAADPKAAKKAQDSALKIQKEIAREKGKEEPNAELLAILEKQLAAATPAPVAAATPAPPPASRMVGTDNGPIATNQTPAAANAALEAKYGIRNPFTAAPAPAMRPAPVTPGPDTDPLVKVRTLKDGSKVTVRQQADGTWVEV